MEKHITQLIQSFTPPQLIAVGVVLAVVIIAVIFLFYIMALHDKVRKAENSTIAALDSNKSIASELDNLRNKCSNYSAALSEAGKKIEKQNTEINTLKSELSETNLDYEAIQHLIIELGYQQELINLGNIQSVIANKNPELLTVEQREKALSTIAIAVATCNDGNYVNTLTHVPVIKPGNNPIEDAEVISEEGNSNRSAELDSEKKQEDNKSSSGKLKKGIPLMWSNALFTYLKFIYSG